MCIDPEDAILTISSNELTILAIRGDGSIADAIGVESVPTPEQVTNITCKNPDTGVRLVPRSTMTKTDLGELIATTVKIMQWGERNKPKSGANLLRKEDIETR